MALYLLFFGCFAIPLLSMNAKSRSKFLEHFSRILPDGILAAVWFVLPWIAIVVGLIIAVCLFHFSGERRRRKDLTRRSAKMGLTYIGNVEDDLLRSLQCFEPFAYHRKNEGRILNLCYRQSDDFYMGVFDYRCLTYGGEGERMASLKTYLHVYSEHFNLPSFVIRPAGALANITRFIAPGITLANYPEFSRKFTVDGKDKDRVREVIGPHVVDFFLAQSRSVVVEGAGQELVLYIPAEAPWRLSGILQVIIPGSGLDNRMDPSELPERMALGRALLNAFTHRKEVEIVDAEPTVECHVIDADVIEEVDVDDVVIIDDNVAGDRAPPPRGT